MKNLLNESLIFFLLRQKYFKLKNKSFYIYIKENKAFIIWKILKLKEMKLL